MNLFPQVDPIPLPAPIWLFKVLHIVTLALHFITVEMLVGGLLVATWLSLYGWLGRGTPSGTMRLNAASIMAKRLPIVVTYVINLGVPPLLFSQVLYGRALYTSSVLIGVYWISVIVILTLAYWLLYQFSAKAEKGRMAWPLGLLAWIMIASIAKIYTTNMTLMIRPEVWSQMYSASAAGVHLPPYDPTKFPRWAFMMVGGLVFAGLWMIYLSGRKNLANDVRAYLSGIGGKLAVVTSAALVALAYKVVGAQPEVVRQGLNGTLLYQAVGYAWLGGIALVILAGLWTGLARTTNRGAGWLAMILALVLSLSMTTYRDGIRDLTLSSKGYDVWSRAVETNWSVVILFLVLFVAGLAGVAWLISVVWKAKPISEKVA